MKEIKYTIILLLVMGGYLSSCHSTSKLTPPSSSNSCIDTSKINPNQPCTKEYAPVCGCDGKTYSNECYAEKAGVTSWEPGDCETTAKKTNSADDCINKDMIESATDCPRDYKPVCGCNGKTFSNDCLAQKAGIQRYTLGKCGDCIDPAKIVNNACTKEYMPVCGCNDVTYGNKCMAKNAGLTSWKKGACE